MSKPLLQATTARRRLLSPGRLALAGAGVAALSGFVIGSRGDRAVHVHLSPVTIAAPSCLAPAPAPPIVVLELQAPERPPEPAPEPAPREDLSPEEATRPRPKPTVYAACVWSESCDDEVDTGFPAISGDGTEIVVQWTLDDGGRGYPNLHAARLNAETGAVIEAYTLLSSDELDEPSVDYDEHREAAGRLVEKRSVALQTYLDDHGFTAMSPLTGETGLELDVVSSNDSLQISDAATGWSRYQETFDVVSEFGPPESDQDICHLNTTTEVAAWLDDASGKVLVAATYGAGPCFCGDATRHYVRKLRAAPKNLSRAD